MMRHLRSALRDVRHDPRQHAATLLICTVASFFGASMIAGTNLLIGVIGGPEGMDGIEGNAAIMFMLLVAVFFGIALFVASMVVTNTFSIVVAGRTRTIAMMRLLGASAARLRWSIAGEGLIIGVLGAALGLFLACGAGLGGAVFLADRGYGEHLPSAVLSRGMLWPGIFVAVMALFAAWRGSRPVLNVSPLEGTRRSTEPALTSLRQGSRVLLVLSILGISGGLGLLLLGVLVGLASPLGVLIGFVGGIISFTGIALGSAWIMPMFLGLAGLLLRGTTAGRMAVGNTRRHPLRAARTSMGLVIGITLIMMFGTVGETFTTVMTRWARQENLSPEETALVSQSIDGILWFLYAMLAFSLLIAGIGVANNMKASIMQRTRELGMLRTIGLSAPSMWRMILIETTQLTLAAALFALPLGVFYGWCGTLSMLASVAHGPFLPTLPWTVAAAVLLGCAVITAVSAALPARQVARVSPVAALAAD